MTGCKLTAGSPTPPSADANGPPLPAAGAPLVVAVAYSGGRDSTALLHATLVAGKALGARVLALHVHHGLSANADAWMAHCEAACRRWQADGHPVDFVGHRLEGVPAAGQSVEAWARQARYAALGALASARGASLVLLGHHRQDQAETWLLQALRGGGSAGLAAMPATADRGGIRWARPWLHRPRSDIEAYIREYRLTYIEDDSNNEPRFARNRLRLQAWPGLTAAFPGAEAALAKAAHWAQEADAVLAELAAIDLAEVAGAEGLALDRWRTLSLPRRSNALRSWLADRSGAPVGTKLAQRLLDELPIARSGRWPVGTGELRLHRGILRLVAASADADRRPTVARETSLSVRRAGTYRLPGWDGSLQVCRSPGRGVALGQLADLELRPRGGGERFAAGIGRPSRSLKKQYQSAGVACWERDGPLIFSAGQLVYVPGLGLDARVMGPPGQDTVDLRWQAGSPVGGALDDG